MFGPPTSSREEGSGEHGEESQAHEREAGGARGRAGAAERGGDQDEDAAREHEADEEASSCLPAGESDGEEAMGQLGKLAGERERERVERERIERRCGEGDEVVDQDGVRGGETEWDEQEGERCTST